MMKAPRMVLNMLVAATVLAAPSTAQAYEVAAGWTVEDYSTGFPHYQETWATGPVGLAFDGQGNLLATGPRTGAIYKIPPGGGPAREHVLREGLGIVTGLAFDLDGRLYMGKADTNEVVEVNPADGTIIRSVVSGLPAPVGLATDPLSGDLFVSNVHYEGGGIFRISNYKNGPGTKTRYGTSDADGLTFAPDGTLYAASSDRVIALAGTNTPTPGAETVVADIPNTDGIAYNRGQGEGEGAFLIVVGTDGKTHRVNLSDGSVSEVITGASRGDLVTVGPDNCMYADLQDRIIKISPSSGACSFSTPAVPDRFNVLGTQFGPPVADLQVKATAARAVATGRKVSFVVKVRNAGPSRAGGVVLSDSLPRGTRLLASASRLRRSGCRRSRGRITCRLGALAPGRGRTFRFPVQALKGKRFVNRATVRGRVLDPRSSNNRSSSVTRVKRARRAGLHPLNAGRT